MTVIALCAALEMADADADDVSGLRALLPLAGMTVIEHQAERARTQKITRMLLLVDGVPAGLAAACDRIRARGVAVELLRDAADVERLAGDCRRLLLVADGLISGDALWAAAADADQSLLLTVEDMTVTAAFERIDAQRRWAGIAGIDAAALSGLTDAPRDWDPQLTLLRQAVQNNAATLAIDPQRFVRGDIAIAQSSGMTAAIEQRVMAAAASSEGGIGQTLVIGPLVRLASRPLLRWEGSGKAARVGAIAAAGLAMAALAAGLVALGLASAIAACGLRGIGQFVALHRTESPGWARIGAVDLAVQLAALCLFGWAMGAGTAPGWLPHSATLLLAPFALWAVQNRPGEVNMGKMLVDLPAIWAGFALLLPVLGFGDALMLVELAVLIAAAIAVWRADRGRADGYRRA